MLIQTAEEIIGTTEVDALMGGIMFKLLDAAALVEADFQIIT